MCRERHRERADARATTAARADRLHEEEVAASIAQRARMMKHLVVDLAAQKSYQRMPGHVRVRTTEARRVDYPDMRVSRVAQEVVAAPILDDAQDRTRPSRTLASRARPSATPEWEVIFGEFQ